MTGLLAASGEFRTTSWTLILRAQTSRADLEALLIRYREPICAYFKSQSRTASDADDLTQEFILKMIEGKFLESANRERGRFRHFLKASLNRFAIDEHRKMRGRDGSRPPTFNSCGDSSRYEAASPRAVDDPISAFEHEYRRRLLSDVREALELRCKAEGLDQHWQAYEARVLRPLLHGGEPASVESLARQFGKPAPKVSHMIETVRRKSVQIARELVAETIENPDELDDEIRALWG